MADELDVPISHRDFKLLIDAYKNNIELSTLLNKKVDDIYTQLKEMKITVDGFETNYNAKTAEWSVNISEKVSSIKRHIYMVYGVLGVMILGLIEIIIRGLK